MSRSRVGSAKFSTCLDKKAERSMAKLVISLNGDVLGHYFLDQDRFTIGRRPTNDLQLDADGVSKEHAAIATVGNDQILEDLLSTNGTFVNGRRTERHILQNNDVVSIGSYQLKYLNQKAKPDMDFDKTMLINALGGQEDREGPRTVSQVATAIPTARQVKTSFPLGGVKSVAGARAGQEIELNRVLATFGKSGEQVAVINRRPHGYFITHVEGKKFPLVNGKSVGAEPYLLKSDDVIEVGGDKLRFFLR
jgi:hypothetical protein